MFRHVRIMVKRIYLLSVVMNPSQQNKVCKKEEVFLEVASSVDERPLIKL